MDISYALAGTRQINVLKNVIGNWTEAMNLANEATNESGVSLANQEKYAKTLPARLKEMGAEGTKVKEQLFNSDVITGTVGALTKFLSAIDLLIEKFGVLKPLAVGVAGALTLKGVGEPFAMQN